MATHENISLGHRWTVRYGMRRAARSIFDSDPFLVAEGMMDRLIMSVVSRIDRGRPRSYHVLLNSSGGGNIGDQAMFESFVHNVEGPIVAIVRSETAFQVPEGRAHGTRIEVLPRLVYGRGWKRLRDIALFMRLLAGARSFSVVGADVMDGGYGKRPSAVEWNLAIAAQRSGVQSRILGFSWNENPRKLLSRLARSAGQQGVIILPRDPQSYSRLSSSGVPGLVQSADLVFSMGHVDEQFPEFEAIRQAKFNGQKVALLNVSGLVSLAVDQTAEYLDIYARLTQLGYLPVFVPHVNHSNVSDENVIATVVDHLPRDAEYVAIGRLLEPGQIKALARLSDVVISGRMHLSILALSAGVPAIVLATQGKVQGLMEMVGTPQLCVVPVPGFSKIVVPLLDDLELNRPRYQEAIRSRLANVRLLSGRNFPN